MTKENTIQLLEKHRLGKLFISFFSSFLLFLHFS